MRLRKRLFEIIESAKESDRVSNIYDIFMMITIVASIIPLAFKAELPVFVIIDKIAVVIFIIDYLLRVLTADYKLNKGALSFILYPITPMALIDLLCILPSLNIISGSFRLLKVFRLFRTFRVFRIFKAVRYSKSIHLIKNVFKNSKKPFGPCGVLAAASAFDENRFDRRVKLALVEIQKVIERCPEIDRKLREHVDVGTRSPRFP